MQPRKTYHIYTHANGFENLFNNDENYRFFLLRNQHFVEPVADTLAYCLMPNHIHFLIRIKTEPEIDEFFGKTISPEKMEAKLIKQFANLFSSYTQSFNKVNGRMGSLFISKFKRKEIETDEYLTNIILYIHRNPVHHGFSKVITNWRWSSYQQVIDSTTTWIKKEEVIRWFGNIEEFMKLHQLSTNGNQELKWFL